MDDYPQLWKRGLIQVRVRLRAKHRCEHCGMEFHHGTNLAITARRRDGHPVVGTVHHIDNNKANCTKINLVYLCQICHVFVQWRWQPGDVLPLKWHNIPPSWITRRGLPYQLHPQQKLKGL